MLLERDIANWLANVKCTWHFLGEACNAKVANDSFKKYCHQNIA